MLHKRLNIFELYLFVISYNNLSLHGTSARVTITSLSEIVNSFQTSGESKDTFVSEWVSQAPRGLLLSASAVVTDCAGSENLMYI